jgi:hypothetical protein
MIALDFTSIRYASLCCLTPSVYAAYQRTTTAATAVEHFAFAEL